ncbi:NADH-dependent [FeFe] hydrogenase, group A6 [Proteinivorax hydrogeniformans]|uniref:NADH-dependent [FeFe] hydrogenase, group A6 n=1 Tax=Proteinivorax hydrogeniformans TaxID=1826727 RepID=A0AAU8HS74_9FIRM
MLTITIDGKQVSTPKGTTILEAAQKAGIDIPTLCHHKDIFPPEVHKNGACRICMVEDVANDKMVPSCVHPVSDKMVINSSSRKIKQARKVILESILENHLVDCDNCLREKKCELMTLAEKFELNDLDTTSVKRQEDTIDISGEGIKRDPQKCILCGRCVRVCSETQSTDILSYQYEGYPDQVIPPFSDEVSPQYHRQLKDTACVECGQCITVCPVGALTEKSHEERVLEAIQDPNMHVIAQTAPAIRVSIGEEFGITPGGVSTGQMVASLKELGFDKVFDTNFTADLTIMEEGHEFIDRVNKGENLPMFTSCSPGWIKFVEHNYPKYLNHLSTCKSPQQMFGALAKTFYAEKMGIDPKNIFSVSVMPCTAKKYEANRPEMGRADTQDVDAVLTTREFARMVKKAKIDFENLDPQEHDNPLGISTGAGAIFGATGGVMEAALRTAVEVITGEELGRLEFEQVRGYDGIKEATLPVGELDVKVAVVHGLTNARKLFEMIKNGDAFYHFVEVMTCPGGCIGGGGQPLPATKEKRHARINAIYEVDKNLPIRKSHENPAVKQLYKEFLGDPLGHKSHELLHTEYTQRQQVSTKHKEIKEAGLSDVLIYPLTQEDGKQAKVLVKPGDEVMLGQKIADANGFYGRPIYSGVAGKVSKVNDEGADIVITPKEPFDSSTAEVSAATEGAEHLEEIPNAVIKQKMVDMGLAKDFGISNKKSNIPLFEKGIDWDSRHKDKLVVNVVGNNSFITKDHRLILEHMNEFLKGIKTLLKVCSLNECVIALNIADTTVTNLLAQKLKDDEQIDVVTVTDRYPTNKEDMLVERIFGTGKSSQECIITDVSKVLSLYRCIFVGAPTLDTVITVDGVHVAHPANYRVKLGVTIKSLLIDAGVDINQIDGNSSSIYISDANGQLQEVSLEDPITRDVHGILNLADLSKTKLNNYEDCVHCGRCVEGCPMELNPNHLSLFAETMQLNKSRLFNVDSCIGCSICAYVCPSNRPISSMIKQTKEALKSN